METSVPDPASAPAGVGIGDMVAVGLATAALFTQLIWSLPSIRRALLRVPEEHRKIPHRWLGLLGVPIISGASAFLVGLGLPRSIHAALDAQGDAKGFDCGRGVGAIWGLTLMLTNLFFIMALGRFGLPTGSEDIMWRVGGGLAIYGYIVTRKFVRKISRASQMIVAK